MSKKPRPVRLLRSLIPPTLRLCVKAAFLRARGSVTPLEEMVRRVCKDRHPRAVQKESEFLRLLRLIESEKPRLFCEIGGFSGGTLFLVCIVLPPRARILSMDHAYTSRQRAAYPFFARNGQRITCMQADSHAAATLERVREWLGPDPLEFLFIDGDHSYAGVSADFQMYAPLVKAGGHIAVHDINPDFKTRYGKETATRTGEVPLFWSKIKEAYPNQTTEYIEDAGQDGYGLGVLRWTGALSP